MNAADLIAAVQALPQLDSDAAAVWASKLKDPNADIAAIEDLVAFVAIWFPEVAPFEPALSLLLPAIVWAAQNPGVGANDGAQSLGKIGAGR